MTALFIDHARALFYRSPVYDFLLGRKAPETIRTPKTNAKMSAATAWYADQLTPATGMPAEEMRGHFRWLSDDDQDPAASWQIISAWCSRHRRWDAVSWRPDLLAERCTRWLAAFDRIGVALDPAERRRWAADILRNARHLARAPLGGVAPWRRMLVHQGRITCALAFPELEKGLANCLSGLGADVDSQVLGDGGHIERNPAKALAVLAILGDIRDALAGHHVEPPAELISAIDRMVPFIKGLCHGDGGFALIGGATAHTGELIADVLAASGGRGRAMTSAPHTGFHRLRAGQTTVVVDCGETLVAAGAYRAPASLEISVGRIRLVGNCGARLAADAARPTWAQALASTAAHSTLVIRDTDAGAVKSVSAERRDYEGARLVEVCHDGYAAAFGITHRRAVFLDSGGDDVRGEDTVSGGHAEPFSIRFHLHPDVRASMVAGGGEVIMKPPRGRGWRFHCRYPVMLEESVSFFDGRHHRAQQIVVLGNHEPMATTVKWRFAMEGGATEKSES